MPQNIDNISKLIDVYASNAITRFISKQKLRPFGGDRRKYKYRVSLLNLFADLENILEDFEAAALGTSGKSIFTAIQFLSNSKRQLDKVDSVLKAYVSESEEKNLDQINELKIEENNIDELLKDFNFNKLNFDYNESAKFKQLETLIEKYNSGEKSLTESIVNLYKDLIKELSKGADLKSLEDVLILRSQNNLNSNASLQNLLKKFYGKALHNVNMFDETSPVRLDVAAHVKTCLNEVQDILNILEDDLNVEELSVKIGEFKKSLDECNDLMKPLVEAIKGSSFGDEFLELIEKNKLTGFPANLSKKDKESFQRYLRTREFRDLLDMYSGKK